MAQDWFNHKERRGERVADGGFARKGACNRFIPFDRKDRGT